jgi:hypothetical protein
LIGQLAAMPEDQWMQKANMAWFERGWERE